MQLAPSASTYFEFAQVDAHPLGFSAKVKRAQSLYLRNADQRPWKVTAKSKSEKLVRHMVPQLVDVYFHDPSPRHAKQSQLSPAYNIFQVPHLGKSEGRRITAEEARRSSSGHPKAVSETALETDPRYAKDSDRRRAAALSDFASSNPAHSR